MKLVNSKFLESVDNMDRLISKIWVKLDNGKCSICNYFPPNVMKDECVACSQEDLAEEQK
jgi:hypothetical protein